VAASPAQAEDLATPVSDLFAAAELELLGHLARAIGQETDPSRWADRRVWVNGGLRSAVDTTSAALRRNTTRATEIALLDAYDRGRTSAVADLGRLNAAAARTVRSAARSTASPRQLAAAVEQDMRPLYRRITTAVTDAYRRIMGRAAASEHARQGIAQQGLNAFAGRGITGLIDDRGRSWSMTGYAATRMRTATGRALIDGHTDLLADVGLGLVLVSDSPLQCPLCRPWERQILTLGPDPGSRTVWAHQAVGERQTVPVRVAGSLAEARLAGLYHPNCTHSVSVYLPGVTEIPGPVVAPARASYEASQQQRYLEQQLRAWHRREAVALDDAARRRARMSIGDYQLRLTTLSRQTGLPRQLDREQAEPVA
jgi:hypothetical protein